MPDGLENRKGARRRSEVPESVLRALNRGVLPTVNLVEFLAMDFAEVVEHVAPGVGLGEHQDQLARTAIEVSALGVMTRMESIGRAIGGVMWSRRDKKKILRALIDHPSDIVRGWGAYTYLVRDDLPVAELLEGLRPFAADPHFGVREFAWGAGRRAVIADLPDALKALVPWAKDRDPNVRRFASEITRPRGVWCPHIYALREDPKPALPILEPLKADAEKYVQDSVANWLNDASKTQPDWVRTLCKRWTRESKSPHTARIVKRALRTIEG